MRLQSQLIIIIICLNAGMALVDGLGALGVLPAYTISHPLTNQTTSTNGAGIVQYGNASDIADKWSQNAPSTIGVIGDMVGSLPTYFKIIADVIGGFPLLIIQIGAMFPLDSVSTAVVLAFATAMATIWGYLMVTYIIELISGRYIADG
jgi:hypothetical protein